MEDKKRISWIDTAKGVGILLVVFFHMDIKQLPGMITGGGYIVAFYMIFFFIMSGLFYNPNNILQRIKSLLVPWCYFYLLGIVIYSLKLAIKHESITFNTFLLPFMGATKDYPNTPLWFLWALAVTSLMSAIILKLTKYNKWSSFIICFSLSVLGFYLGKYSIINKYYMSVCLLVIPFFYGGSVLREWLLKERSIALYITAFLFSLLLYLIKPEWCNVSQCSVPMSYIRWVIIVCFASYALMGLCMYLDKNKLLSSVFSYFGRNSLIVLCTHSFLLFIPTLFQNLFINQWFAIILGLVIVMLVEFPIIYLINKYFRFMIAR